MIPSELLQPILRSFQDIDGICGAEATFQSNIAHHLKMDNYNVQLEYPASNLIKEPSKQRIDAVILDAPSGEPLQLIEIKGGAYGDRQALKDCIDRQGNCKDFTKLQQYSDSSGAGSIFIAIDLPMLGRHFKSTTVVENFFSQAHSYGVEPILYSMGDDACQVAGKTPGSFQWVSLSSGSSADSKNSTGSDWLLDEESAQFQQLYAAIKEVTGHEYNVVSCIYSALRNAGINAKQISLETYFSFASFDGSPMQKRPDVCIFEQGFDGQFNLYRLGNRDYSNDEHKLASLLGVVELKSRLPGKKVSDKKFATDIAADIDKLHRWKRAVEREGGGDDVTYISFVADMITRPLPEMAKKGLASQAVEKGVHLVFVSSESCDVFGASSKDG